MLQTQLREDLYLSRGGDLAKGSTTSSTLEKIAQVAKQYVDARDDRYNPARNQAPQGILSKLKETLEMLEMY
jgi:hypothetical protein